MPAKNRIKIYTNGGYYHIYNRGVAKQSIFHTQQDYAVFLSYLKTYLMPKDEKGLNDKLSDPKISYKERDNIIRLLRLNNFANEIRLLAYCLMPNHFHFFIKQKSAQSIDIFMNSLGTRYTMYFNRKHKRVGPLYQGVYKAVLVESDEQLIYLTSYIHQNPLSLASKGQAFRAALLKQPSSYPEYLGERHTEWIHPEEILSFFSKKNPSLSYSAFVEQSQDYSLIKDVVIDQ